jgi:membrane-anchored protein YejM (alkaline phosphatase superfamily)
MDYRAIFALGFFLVVLGVVLPWLMFLRIIQSTWVLVFLSFIASLAGVILGVVGAAYYVRLHRK